MAQNKEKSVFAQIIITVVVALLVGGTSPWWWEKIFPGNVLPTPPPTPVPSPSPTPSPPPSPIFHGGPITATASTDPSIISRGQQTSINVYAQNSQGHPLPSATVILSSGGGRFSQTGTTTVSGMTDSSGSFRAFWSCDMCAPGYIGGVRITKQGYEEANTEWRVKIR